MTPAQVSLLNSLNQIRSELVAKGESVIDLCMINPDMPPPRMMLDKLVEATLKSQNHRYAVSRGVRKLREGFQSKYKSAFGVDLDPEREICVTMGAKDGIFCLMLALKELGLAEQILVGAPIYPAYLASADLAELSVERFEITASEQQMLTAIEGKLLQKPGTLVLLNFPNNPTGISVSSRFWDELSRMALKYQAMVVNDFVYGEMSFEHANAVSALSSRSAPENVLECYSLSKSYAIPGWRMAAVLGAERVISRVSGLKSHLDYGIFLPLQYAAAFALGLKGDLVSEIRSEYHRRISMFTEGIKQLGFSCLVPSAGASVWCQLPEHWKPQAGKSLACSMLEAGVFGMPGELFGLEYRDWIRFAMVRDVNELRSALERLTVLGERLG